MAEIIFNKNLPDIKLFKIPYFLYELIDPTDNSIRYVGKTNKPNKRLVLHLSRARKSTKTRKDAWIKGLINKSLSPIMHIIKICELENINQLEIDTIAEYKKIHNLYNMTLGGEGMPMTEEVRKKVSLGKMGKPGHKPSEETRKRMSKAQKGKFAPKWKPETFAKNCVRVVGTDTLTDLQICFKSLKDAADFVKGRSTHVRRCCIELKVYKNFKWEYIKE